MASSPHPAALPVDVLRKACETRRTRRSGPGGQHRNKVETAVIVTHSPSGVSAEANERRQQAENLAMALFRLRVNLALDVRTLTGSEELPPCPSELWRSRCPRGRIAVNPAHDDFPALLAEALDVLDAYDHDPKPAAEFLGSSSSQLVKFLKLEPRAFALVNQRRAAAGLHGLK